MTVAVVDPPPWAEIEKSVPVPDSESKGGLPGALSVMVKVALRVPVPMGANEIGIVQTTAGATLVPQVSVPFLKSPLFVPEIVMSAIVRLALPELLSVTDCAVLVVPMI